MCPIVSSPVPPGRMEGVAPSLPIQQTAGNRSIRVDAAIAQEGPVAADVFQVTQVHFAEQNLFPVVRRFRHYAAKGVTEERASPELEALAGSGVAADVAGFQSDSIHNADI